jgi:hypothetical protein
MSKLENVAASVLLKSMGENPRRLVPGSLGVRGRSVDWTETCNYEGTCLHSRCSNASMDALDAYFEALAEEHQS